MQPAGAHDFVRWRRSIVEHLELGRLSWDEYGLFNWLCTKADPRTGTLRTSWPVLAEQTTLSANYVGKLCGRLKHKGYIDYPHHGGRRVGLIEVAIDKFPLTDGTYTALRRPAAEVLAEVPAEVVAEVKGEKAETTRTSPRRIYREREILKTTLRARSAGADQASDLGSADATAPFDSGLTREQVLAVAPDILRETLELFFLKTGRDGLGADQISALDELERAHTPAVIQRAISRAVARFTRRGQFPRDVTLVYVWESLKRFTTRQRKPHALDAEPAPKYPLGVTLMTLSENPR